MGKKDPNAPKRPLSAYFAWLGENRNKVKADNPDMKHKDVTSKLGAMWGALDESVKKEYKDTASGQMQIWKKKFEVYKKTEHYAAWQREKALEAPKGKTKRKKKAPKDPNAPKRPSTGFFLFVQDNRAEVKAALAPEDKKKVTMVTKRCGVMWKECSDEQKASYKERSTKLKQAYDEKMGAYKETDEYAQFQTVLLEFRQKQKAETAKAKRKPKRQLQMQSESESDSEESS